MEAISTLEGRQIESLPPLPEEFQKNVDAIVDFDEDDPQTAQHLRLTLEYLDYYVTLENDGSLSVKRKSKRPFETVLPNED